MNPLSLEIQHYSTINVAAEEYSYYSENRNLKWMSNALNY